ncbi:MAG TPA: hypothetical protein DCS93_08750 [Microscillaceae bacterium]|nr:hypothetical protein [Microscillaceae bacterium]
MSSNNQVPAIRPMQFGADGQEIFQDSVNLFRGDVNLSLDLVNLKGRNGLDLKLTASYGSNVKNTIQVSNVSQPTGILGLGWSLPFQRIEVDDRGNASSNDNKYYLYTDNNSIALEPNQSSWLRAQMSVDKVGGFQATQLSQAFLEAGRQAGLNIDPEAKIESLDAANQWKITDKKQQRILRVERQDHQLLVYDGGISFEGFQYDFTRIIYYPEFERWETINDDGTINSFGGLPADAQQQDGIQWKVRWPNWVGSSNLVKDEGQKVIQERYPVAWNLKYTQNTFGDTIQYSYEVVEQPVGEDGLHFTKACYLSQIEDMYGRKVLLNYQEKVYTVNDPSGAREYLAPHWNDPYTQKPNNDYGPFQDKYETLYLSNIAIHNQDSALLYTIMFTYDEASNFSGYAQDNPLYGDTVKRTLTNIKSVLHNGTSLPGLSFSYWDATSVNAGALRSGLTSKGAEVTYHYKKQELPECNHQQTIDDPWAGSGTPRVWFGADYVSNIWVNSNRNKLQVSFYTWLGRWQLWQPATPVIDSPLDLETLNAVTAEDFACLCYTNVQAQKSYIHPYHKNALRWGEWYETTPIELATTNYEVAAGDNFFLVCDQDNRKLYRYSWDVFTKEWIISDQSGVLQSGNPNATPYITAVHKQYALLDYQPAGSGSRHNPLTLFYQTPDSEWHKGASTILTFTVGGNDPRNQFGFTASASFLALTYINDEFSESFNYTVKVVSWDENYTHITSQDFTHRLPKSVPSRTITIPFLAQIIGNNLIASGPYLIRYNGLSWLANDKLYFRTTINDEDINWFAYGHDYALYTSNREYAAQAKLLAFDPTTNTFEWDNEPLNLFDKDGTTDGRKTRYFPTAGVDIATFDNQVYHRGSQTDWQVAAQHHESLSSDINSTTMINQGPGFLSFLNTKNSSPESSSVWNLLNQFLEDEVIIDQRYFTPIDDTTGFPEPNTNGQYPAGSSTFVTSLPLNKPFSNASQITIHRYLEGTIQGKVVDYCVERQEINNGYDLSTNQFVFDPASATCDPTGGVVKYYSSKFYPGAESLATPTFGWIENTYYNQLLPPSQQNNAQPETQITSLLDGQLILRKTLDSAGKVLTEDAQNLATFGAIQVEGRDKNLYGGYFRVEENTQVQDGLTKTTRYFYNVLGNLIQEEYDNVTINEKLETIRKSYSYAYEVYPWFGKRNVINAPLLEIQSVVPEETGQEQVIAASLQTYEAIQIKPDENTPALTTWATLDSYVLQQEVPMTDLAANKLLTNNQPNDDWRLVNKVLTRTTHGLVQQQRDVTGVVGTSVYSKDDMLTVANFKTIGKDDAFYVGFAAYEDYEANWQLQGGGTVNSQLVQGDAKTGDQSFNLAAGSTLGKTTALEVSEKSVIAAWVKASKGFVGDSGVVNWVFTQTGGPTQTIELAVEEEEVWTYWQGVLDVETTETLNLALQSTKSSQGILINNITFAPLAGEASVSVYDPLFNNEIANSGRNADVAYNAYDPLNQAIAVIGASGAPQTGTALFNTRAFHEANGRFSFPQDNPNSSIEISPALGGLYENFTNGAQTWNNWQTANQQAWQVTNSSLQHTLDESSAINWTATEAYTGEGLSFSVLIPTPTDAQLEFGFGNDIQANWDSSNGWTLKVGQDTYTDQTATQRPINVFLIPIEGRLYLIVNGKPLFSPKTTVTPSGAMTLQAKGKMSFTNFVIYDQPQLSATYLDGASQEIQTQAIDTARVLVKQKLYDALGSVTIETKIAAYEEASIGYQTGFVTSVDKQSGVMTGKVSDYYPADEGYPYARTMYEGSNLKRVIKKGNPGKDFAITQDNQHIGSRAYGVTTQSSVANIPFVEGSFLVNLATDANGSQIYEIKDRMGRVLGKQTEVEQQVLAKVQQVYDTQGNLAAILPPNSFTDADNGDDFSIKNTYDFLKQLTQRVTPDSGETKIVYDLAGRPRFRVNTWNESQNRVLYTKYDQLSRVIEEGWVEGTWGDGSHWQEIANTNPAYPTDNQWTKQTIYDGTGEDAYLVGKIWKAQSQPSNNQQIENVFAYDVAGNSVGSTLHMTDQPSQTFEYAYDNLKHVTAITYPETAPIPKVVYQYNVVGQNVRIGTPNEPEKFAKYTYNANGSLSQESLNNQGGQAIQRSLTYNSPGWIEQMKSQFANNQAILDLELAYTKGGYENASYYNGNLANISTKNGIVPANSFDYAYQYDGRGQLAVADYTTESGETAQDTMTNVYDLNGNITAKQTASGLTNFAYESGSNRLAQASIEGNTVNSFQYNENGSVTSTTALGITDIGYDSLTNLATSITKQEGTQIDYAYNGLNQRTLKVVDDNQALIYAYGFNRLPLLEVQQDTTQYIYGVGGLVSMLKEAVSYYMVKDQQGSIRAITDEQGQVKTMLDYTAFGEVLANAYGDLSLARYRFTGQEWDEETGLYNFQARLYDAQLGRFYSIDPVLQYTSPYLYCGNDPINLNDPSGELAFLAIILIAAAIGAALGAAAATYTGVKSGLSGGELVGYIFAGAAIGAVAGALSAAGGVGAFAAGSAAAAATTTTGAGIAAGIAAGAGVGAVVGAGVGAAQGAAQYFVNEAFGVANSGSLGSAILQGAVSGAITGAFSGGVQGAGGAFATLQSVRLQELTGTTNYSFKSLTSVSKAYQSFNSLGVVPIPSVLTRTPYVRPVASFVFGKFTIPTITKSVGSVVSKGVTTLAFSESSSSSDSQSPQTSPATSQSQSYGESSDYYAQKGYNSEMYGSIGQMETSLTNPEFWQSSEE